jgi:hypothetical protein
LNSVSFSATTSILTMNRYCVLIGIIPSSVQSHHRAAEIHPADAVERRFGDLRNRRIIALNADAHIVMQHVNSSPAPHSFGHSRLEGCLARHVGHERGTVRTRGTALPRGFLSEIATAINGENARPLLCKAQCRSASIANGFARILAGPHDHRYFVFRAHPSPLSLLLHHLATILHMTAASVQPAAWN